MPGTDGKLKTYEVKEFSNFSAELSTKFPSIKTYRGKALHKPQSMVSISISDDHI